MRTAVVTGAAGGMGRATCRVLVKRGWRVVALDAHEERLGALADHLGEVLVPVVCDLAAEGLREQVASHLDDRVAGLVNLAGVSTGDRIDRLTDAAWRTSFAVNVDGPMRLAQVCAPHLAAAGGGSIVNVSSPVGFIGARKPSYAASKAALLGLTMSLARNLGAAGTRANLLLPGTTITHMTDDWSAERRANIASETLLGRLCEAEEVGKVIAFLLSDDASYMTGSVVDMTCGGMLGH